MGDTLRKMMHQSSFLSLELPDGGGAAQREVSFSDKVLGQQASFRKRIGVFNSECMFRIELEDGDHLKPKEVVITLEEYNYYDVIRGKLSFYSLRVHFMTVWKSSRDIVAVDVWTWIIYGKIRSCGGQGKSYRWGFVDYLWSLLVVNL